jgi:hypothetical protein
MYVSSYSVSHASSYKLPKKVFPQDIVFAPRLVNSLYLVSSRQLLCLLESISNIQFMWTSRHGRESSMVSSVTYLMTGWCVYPISSTCGPAGTCCEGRVRLLLSKNGSTCINVVLETAQTTND